MKIRLQFLSAPMAEQFYAAMEVLGVGDDSRVVQYDAHSAWMAWVW